MGKSVIYKFIIVLSAVFLPRVALSSDLYEGFLKPEKKVRPWCYYISFNGHFDKPTIDADVAAMDSLGFGGVLFTDISGYHSGGEEHLDLPERRKEWMGREWLSDLRHLAGKLSERGMQLTMNVSSHGGSMKGPWDNGPDAPKMLVYHISRPGEPVKAPDLKHFKSIARFAVRLVSVPEFVDEWKTAAGGPADMASGLNLKSGETAALRARQVIRLGDKDISPRGKDWVELRLGYGTIPGYEHDLDVLDKDAVRRYLVRMSEMLKTELGPLFGRTLTHYYSVSWEGSSPTWSTSFAEDFQNISGYDIIPYLPSLCGIRMEGDDRIQKDFRSVRNEMFLRNFYCTMAKVSHSYGLKVYSESGGPWFRTSEAMLEADQHRFLSINDMPQGEFWLIHNFLGDASKPVMHVRGAASAAHTYGKKLVSAEAFTHMTYHWSAYPARLKPIADQAFIDGCNHFVWHTYTSSPSEFGIPGIEYFAGTHINRNVTWQKEAGAFLNYLARCQYMLRQGDFVSDLAVWAGSRVYQNYGDYIDTPYDGSSLKLPQGYPYDILNTETLLNRSSVVDGRLVLQGGASYKAICVDSQFEDDLTPAVRSRLEKLSAEGVRVIYEKENVNPGFLPDVQSRFTAVHRKSGNTDIYFVKGSGADEVLFRCRAENVQIWNPVTAEICNADYSVLDDGRTKVHLELPENGSAFVVFGSENKALAGRTVVSGASVEGPWTVSFRYMEGIASAAPKERVWNELKDITADDDFDVKHFSGDVTYSTTFSSRPGARYINLGTVLGGLAKVYVNGKDCGVVWTSPWRVDLSSCNLQEENKLEIVYTNCWVNRMIGDCKVPENERVTRTNVRVGRGTREMRPHPKNPYSLLWPSVYSRFLDSDSLMPSGVLGPVCLEY